MNNKERPVSEEQWAAAWAASLSPPQRASAQRSGAAMQTSTDLLTVFQLLDRLAEQQHSVAQPDPHPEDGFVGVQQPSQRAAQSAFHPFTQQQQGKWSGQAQPEPEPEPLTKHLEAVSFWIQLYQIAQSGLKSAMQQAQAAFPSFPTGVLGAAADPQDGRARAALPGVLGVAPMAQLQALLQNGVPSAHSQPQNLHQQLQQLLQHKLVTSAAAAQPQQGFLAECSLDMLQLQQPQGFNAERSLDRLLQPQQPQGFNAERSLDRLQQQQQQQQQQQPLGFSAERSLDRLQLAQPQGFYAERSLDRLQPPQGFFAEHSLDRLQQPQGFGTERSLERVDPDSVVGFGKDWSLDPSDQSQEQLRKRRKAEEGRVCSNCATTSTPFWRKDRTTGLALCNACGLYASKNDHPRPVKLWGPGGLPPGLGNHRSSGGGPLQLVGGQVGLTMQQCVAAAIKEAQQAQQQGARGEAWQQQQQRRTEVAEAPGGAVRREGKYSGSVGMAPGGGQQGGEQAQRAEHTALVLGSPMLLVQAAAEAAAAPPPAAASASAFDSDRLQGPPTLVETRRGPLIMSPLSPESANCEPGEKQGVQQQPSHEDCWEIHHESAAAALAAAFMAAAAQAAAASVQPAEEAGNEQHTREDRSEEKA